MKVISKRILDAFQFTQEMVDDLKLAPGAAGIFRDHKAEKFHCHGLNDKLNVGDWIIIDPVIGVLEIVDELTEYEELME